MSDTNAVRRRRGRPALIELSASATIVADEPVGEVARGFERWLEVRQAANRISSQRTVDGYRDDMSRWATLLASPGDGPAWDRWTLEDLKTERIQTGLAEMARAGLSVSARKRALAPLSGLCGWLARTGALAFDPTASEDLSIRSAPPPFPKSFSDEEMARIVTAVTAADGSQRDHLRWSVRDLAALGLLAGCGLRAEELCGLTWRGLANLDEELPTVRVLGKGSREREVPISPRVAQTLRSYRDERRAIRDNPKLRVKPSAPVIVQTDGRPITQSVLRVWMERWLKEANVPAQKGAMAHAFRHTAADGWLANGATLAEVQELLGHASIATTGRYTRVRLDRLHDAVRAGRLEQTLRSSIDAVRNG